MHKSTTKGSNKSTVSWTKSFFLFLLIRLNLVLEKVLVPYALLQPVQESVAKPLPEPEPEGFSRHFASILPLSLEQLHKLQRQESRHII